MIYGSCSLTLLARRLAAISQNGSRRLRGLRRFPEGERPGREDRRIVRSLVSESEEVKASFVAVCNPIEKLDFSPFLHALVIQSAIDPLFSLSVAGKPIMMVSSRLPIKAFCLSACLLVHKPNLP